MAIPPFRVSGVLPPYIGDPARGQRSPYRVPPEDFVTRFATSITRCTILDGWLSHRKALRGLGLTGFQWLDGSFCEELTAPREPGDVDVLTLMEPPATVADRVAFLRNLLAQHPTVFRAREAKATYHCDAYFIELFEGALARAQVVHYWYGLFSHRKGDDLWKGIIEVSLDGVDDALAGVRLVQRKLEVIKAEKAKSARSGNEPTSKQ